MLPLGPSFASLFSTDAAVHAAVAELWPSFCFFLFTSGPFALMLGLLRGLGLQKEFAMAVIFLLWPVGATLVIWVAHSPAQVWRALTATYWLLVATMACLAGCSSWRRLSDKAIAASGGAALGAATTTMVGSSVDSAAAASEKL